MVDVVPLYKVGDKLRVLINNPWSAPRVRAGSIIEIKKIVKKYRGFYNYRFVAENGDVWALSDKQHNKYVEFYNEPNDIEWWIKNGNRDTRDMSNTP